MKPDQSILRHIFRYLVHVSNGHIALEGYVVIYALDIVLVVSLLIAAVLLFRKIIPAVKAKKTVPRKALHRFSLAAALAFLAFLLIWWI